MIALGRALAIASLVLACGCQGREEYGGGGVELLAGRYQHAVIQRTIAPWDGPATQIFLSEKPMEENKLGEPHVAFIVYTSANGLSFKRHRLEGNDRKKGTANWVERDGKATPISVEIHFEDVREDAPVRGRYDVAFPDGRRERGHFQAKWWPAHGPGG
jgi:hypothetical protein